MTKNEFIEGSRDVLLKMYPNYWDLPSGERVLLCMAYFADRLKIKEEGGNNAGTYVELILKCVGLGKGYPWCAAAITAACLVAKVHTPTKPAAVVEWVKWAKKLGNLQKSPKRGSLCFWVNKDGVTGHIGIVTRGLGPLTQSIEGNTSSGEAGSQRDGDGLFRRVRKTSTWNGFIDLI